MRPILWQTILRHVVEEEGKVGTIFYRAASPCSAVACWMFCAGLLTATASGQNPVPATCSPVTVGSYNTTWDHPFHTYHSDNRSQSIYLASQVGPAGMITELALNVTTAPTVNITNWTIRMKHTNLTAYSSAYLEPGGWTTVYSAGSIPAGTTGWRTFTFSAPFTYDGVSNLMIDFSSRDVPYAFFNGIVACSSGTNRTAFRNEDGGTNPLNWSGTTGGAARRDWVPQVMLTICTAGGPPGAPSNFAAASKTTNSITWSWTPGSADADGYNAHDASETLVWTAPAGTSYVETGLAANTQYTRHIHSYTESGTSEASNTAFAYTLPVAPSVNCNLQLGCPVYAIGSAFTFSNAVAFGSGGVNHYHYVWDRSWETQLDGTEPSWASGTIQLTANQAGYWYLHLVSHNAEHTSGGEVYVGPFVVATITGYTPGDFDFDCDVDQTDLDFLDGCGSGPGVQQSLPACAAALLDGDADVDSDDFALFQRCWSREDIVPDLDCAR